MLSMDREQPNSDRNLYMAVSTLESVFAYPKFPQDLAPPANWAKTIDVQSPNVFDENLMEWVKRDKHPYTWEEGLKIDPNLEETLQRAFETIRARVDFDDPRNPHVIIRRSPGFLQARVGEILLTLAHEAGHLSTPTIVEPLPEGEVENIIDLLSKVEESGYSVDPTKLMFRRQGGNMFITFEGRRLFMLGDFGKDYGTFFDELYADIYKFFALSHLIMMKSGARFEDAMNLTLQQASNPNAGIDAVYMTKVIGYANKVGWIDLLRAGKSSDKEAFLKIGNDAFGEEDHKSLLDEIHSLRSNFCIVP